MRRLPVLLALLSAIFLGAVPAEAVDVRVGGLMRVRINVASEFDGRNEWTSTEIANAKAGGAPWSPFPAAGNYNSQHIYDRGSHFFAAGPGTNALGANTEDNPSAAGYWGPQNTRYFPPNDRTGFSPAGGGAAGTAGVGGNTTVGPDLWSIVSPALLLPDGTRMRNSQDFGDDDVCFLDQRLDVYLTFILADCLSLNTSFRTEGAWGLAGQGADWGADDVDIALETCYLDVELPFAPVEASVGVQTFYIHRGWLLNVTAPGLYATAILDPFNVSLIYSRVQEGGSFEDRNDDIDLYGTSASYATHWMAARGTILYQDGPSATFTSAETGKQGAVEAFGNTIHWYALDLGYYSDLFKVEFTGIMNGGTNDYYRLDDRYSDGSAKPVQSMHPVAADYNGYLLDLAADIYTGPVRLAFEAFYTSGDEFKDFGYDNNDIAAPGDNPGGGSTRNNFFFYQDADDAIDRMVYPGPRNDGVDMLWSEILGAGVFDQGNPGGGGFGQYGVGGAPYNIWALKLGADWRLTDLTTFSFAYWYVNTAEDVVGTVDETRGAAYGNVMAMDSDLGHEFDFYISHSLCDGLELTFVGAYLFSGGAVSIWDNDEDMFEYGLRLQVQF